MEPTISHLMEPIKNVQDEVGVLQYQLNIAYEKLEKLEAKNKSLEEMVKLLRSQSQHQNQSISSNTSLPYSSSQIQFQPQTMLLPTTTGSFINNNNNNIAHHSSSIMNSNSNNVINTTQLSSPILSFGSTQFMEGLNWNQITHDYNVGSQVPLLSDHDLPFQASNIPQWNNPPNAMNMIPLNLLTLPNYADSHEIHKFSSSSSSKVFGARNCETLSPLQLPQAATIFDSDTIQGRLQLQEGELSVHIDPKVGSKRNLFANARLLNSCAAFQNQVVKRRRHPK